MVVCSDLIYTSCRWQKPTNPSFLYSN